MEVQKRTGEVVTFDSNKIMSAVGKAMTRTDHDDPSLPECVVSFVKEEFNGTSEPIHVDNVHEVVENALMDAKAFDVAREYVTYRNKNMPDIFRERIAYKPFEYPSLGMYVDAIQQSYWIVTEFGFQSDVQEFKTEMSFAGKEAVRRSMLSISQVEVGVKTFWGNMGNRVTKPEVQEVGATFSESEARHARAYSHLLEVLGLNSDFSKVLEVPAIKRRVDYAQKALAKGRTDSNKDYMESILLFSLFIENVSLFSQFLIISQINKETGMLKGMSNVVAATSLEERTHADFGYELINIIRRENPEWFDEDLNARVKDLVMESFDAETGIVEWIFGEGELDCISTEETIEYIKNRYNLGLESAGFEKMFDIDQDKLERVKWFDVQNTATSHTDFFAQRSINYTKADTAFDEDSLF